MENLTVTPEYLEGLAQILDAAAEQAEDAKKTTMHVPDEIELTWGPFLRGTNDAFTHAEHNRHYAVSHFKAACTRLAKIARSAAAAYASTDALSAENLDKQLLDY